MSNARSPLDDCSKTVGIRDWRMSGMRCSGGHVIDDISSLRYHLRDGRPRRRQPGRASGVTTRVPWVQGDGRQAQGPGRHASRPAATEIGLSQTEVAARMGTSQSAVARLESGDADVRLSTLERYVAALGERLDWGFERPVGKSQSTPERNPKGHT